MPPQTGENSSINNLLPDLEARLRPDSGGSSSGPVVSRIKCVLLGDGAVGKTSLIVSYTTNGYPSEYVPTTFDNYSAIVTVDKQPIRLQLCDTAGQDDFDSLRPLCYPDTDVFLLCFSIVSPTSFHNVSEKWLPEIKRHREKTPILLVGTQCDLRHDIKVLLDLAHYKEHPVSTAMAVKLAQKVGAIKYIECSALTQKNLKEVFDTAILAGLSLDSTPDADKVTDNEKSSRDLISWGKYKGKKILCNFNKDSKERCSCRSDSGTTSVSKDYPFHCKHRLDPQKAPDEKKTGWKKLVCCL